MPMNTQGYHTCSMQGGRDEVLKNAPFEAKHDPPRQHQFLGTGYYYWDYNLEYAKIYGKRKYPYGFFVIETEINLAFGTFLDLVGRRQDMDILLKLKSRLAKIYKPASGWFLGSFIEYLKVLQFEPGFENIFPYKAVRVIDMAVKREDENEVKFVDKSDMYAYVNLNPRMIICVYEKNNAILQSSKIVYAGTNGR